jgi:hypothetical protein
MAYAAITRPTDNFRTKLYAGNGSARSITFDESANMQPDLLWVKGRDTTASWLCNDVVRGATKRFKLDMNSAESTETGMITSFNTNGFSLGTTSTSNNNGSNYVSYGWKAGGSSTTTPSGGTITTTASVNTTAGLSIFTYTGNGNAAHLAHGLGVAPDVVIIKGRTNSDNWFMKHPSLASNEYIYLNDTGTKTSGANVWSNTNPDATKIYVGTDAGVNANGTDYVGYAFAEKKGYSKFGSYTGNGNADGTFVYTGFKPAWILIKHSGGGTAGGEHWNLQDVKRSTENPSIIMISPNSTNGDNSTTNNSIDIVSNGFKVRTNDGRLNNSGATYIYMAFAKEPLVANVGQSIPTTAR